MPGWLWPLLGAAARAGGAATTELSLLAALTTLLQLVLVGAGLTVLGGGALLWWRARAHGDAPRVRTGQVGRRLRILRRVTTGGVLVDPPVLRSPLGGLDCVAWRVRVSACWHVDGVRKERQLHAHTELSPLVLDDGSGPVQVALAPGDRIEWIPSHDQQTPHSLVDAVLGRVPEQLPGSGQPLSLAGVAGLPERIESIRREEQVLPVAHRYLATGEAVPGRVARGPSGPLVLVRDMLPPALWVGRRLATRAMVIGAAVLAAGTLLGLWLGRGG